MKYTIALLVLTVLLLAGCGQKGPLYLPSNEPAQQTTPDTQAQLDQADQATATDAASTDQP